MNWTNELSRQFRKFLAFFLFFLTFLSKYLKFLQFSGILREIPTKFHQILAEKMTKFIDFLLEWNELQFILAKISDDFLLKFWNLRGAKVCKSCRSRKMLKNAPTLAIVAVDTAENEPLKISLVHFISSIASLAGAPGWPPRSRLTRIGACSSSTATSRFVRWIFFCQTVRPRWLSVQYIFLSKSNHLRNVLNKRGKRIEKSKH